MGTTAITAWAGQVRRGVDVVVVAPEVATIVVNVPSEVRAGTRTPLAGRALDRHGRPMGTAVRWASRNPAVASVTDDGTLSAKRRGVAVVVAESGGVARAATIVVMPPPVVAVVIDGVAPALVVGTATSLRAIARMAARAESVDQERTFEWRSSDPAIAPVSADGTVTARKPGRATISATCEGVRGQVDVTVVTVRAHSIVVKSPSALLRRGDTATLSASVYDVSGNVLERPVTWRSSDARVVSVDQEARIVARDEGWAIVTAQADGINPRSRSSLGRPSFRRRRRGAASRGALRCAGGFFSPSLPRPLQPDGASCFARLRYPFFGTAARTSMRCTSTLGGVSMACITASATSSAVSIQLVSRSRRGKARRDGPGVHDAHFHALVAHLEHE